MKKILMLLVIATALSCNSRSDRQSNVEQSSRNEDDNVEENSGENISPQLEDSTDRFNVDSISSAQEANEKKKNELEDGKAKQ